MHVEYGNTYMELLILYYTLCCEYGDNFNMHSIQRSELCEGERMKMKWSECAQAAYAYKNACIRDVIVIVCA